MGKRLVMPIAQTVAALRPHDNQHETVWEGNRSRPPFLSRCDRHRAKLSRR